MLNGSTAVNPIRAFLSRGAPGARPYPDPARFVTYPKDTNSASNSANDADDLTKNEKDLSAAPVSLDIPGTIDL